MKRRAVEKRFVWGFSNGPNDTTKDTLFYDPNKLY